MVLKILSIPIQNMAYSFKASFDFQQRFLLVGFCHMSTTFLFKFISRYFSFLIEIMSEIFSSIFSWSFDTLALLYIFFSHHIIIPSLQGRMHEDFIPRSLAYLKKSVCLTYPLKEIWVTHYFLIAIGY